VNDVHICLVSAMLLALHCWTSELARDCRPVRRNKTTSNSAEGYKKYPAGVTEGCNVANIALHLMLFQWMLMDMCRNQCKQLCLCHFCIFLPAVGLYWQFLTTV